MRSFLRNLAWVVGVVAVVVGLLRLTLFTTWTVPSDDPELAASMAPNVYAGDLLVLSRLTPTVGDLVRCADPDQPGRYVVGRLIGEQGEEIEVGSSEYTANNRRSATETSCLHALTTIEDPSSGAPVELYCAYEAFRNHKHMRLTAKSSGYNADFKTTVSDGNVFLVSDNRAYPFDSRKYGAIPRSSCKETVVFRLKGKKGYGDTETRFTSIR